MHFKLFTVVTNAPPLFAYCDGVCTP
eukprot:SAG22_NODE_18948_length_279_cov_1.438889_2_plen_25_part_01